MTIQIMRGEVVVLVVMLSTMTVVFQHGFSDNGVGWNGVGWNGVGAEEIGIKLSF